MGRTTLKRGREEGERERERLRERERGRKRERERERDGGHGREELENNTGPWIESETDTMINKGNPIL